jgi:1,4-dihydroxy-2-naphthoate octaprenyltransferase
MTAKNKTLPQNTNPLDAWLLAARPKTLPASVSPVIVGTAMTVADGRFAFFPALAALIGALLLQIGVNLANDYFDHQKGIDTEERLGPIRVTQSGLIPPGQVKKAMIAVICGAAAVGIYLVYVGGWPIFIVGLAAVLSTLAYSGGPYPLASHGLGDLFVFIFFGPVAVCGTYYVQARQLSPSVIWLSLPVGFLITAIIVVNNLRDIATDRKTGKNTLAVRLGIRLTRLEYLLLIAVSFAVTSGLFFSQAFSVWVLLPLVSLPLFVPAVRTVYTREGAVLNRALAKTASLTLFFCLLLSAGLLLST